jgi:hypothetical protein
MTIRLFLALLACGTALPVPAAAQSADPAQVAASPGWTARADLALASPTIVRATLARAERLRGAAAAGVPPGEARWLMTADLTAALKAPGLLPARAEWIWQGPASRRPPLPRGADLLLFLSAPRAGPKPEVAQFQLVAPGGQLGWTAAAEATVRAVLAEAGSGRGYLARSVGEAFHSEGTVAGASQSQFFIDLDDGRRLVAQVTRAPGQAPRVQVATGDVIAATAIGVPRETLLWRALACGLPAAAPPAVAANPDLTMDYRVLRDTLGDCGPRGL